MFYLLYVLPLWVKPLIQKRGTPKQQRLTKLVKGFSRLSTVMTLQLHSLLYKLGESTPSLLVNSVTVCGLQWASGPSADLGALELPCKWRRIACRPLTL
jgi:hypothetical protein